MLRFNTFLSAGGRAALLGLMGLLLALFNATGSAAATTTIYADGLTSGWANWSWATVNLVAASPTHSGTASIAVTYSAAWQGLSLAYPTGLDTAAASKVRFFLHGGNSGGQLIQLYALLEDGSNGPVINLTPPTANSWSEVQVPLADLGAANAIITGLVWQDYSGHSQSTFYVDDLTLADDAHPAGPTFTTITLLRDAAPADGSSGVVIKATVSDPQGLGDIASVTLDGSPLGRGLITLLDDGRHNDGPANDGMFGAVVTIAPATPPGEIRLLLTARDQANHSTLAQSGALVVLGSPGGALPTGLPSGPAWGTTEWNETPGSDWQVNSGVPWQYVYQYITYDWVTNGWGGNFVQRFTQQAWDKGYIPVISVYLMLGLTPGCTTESPACYASKLQNSTAVSNYLAALTEAANQANGSQPVIFHLEPDFYGFMQQYNYQQNVAQPDSPANYPVALNIAGYPNDLRGLGRRMVDVIHQAAPKALVAPHASMWATNLDPSLVTAVEVAGLAQSTATFMNAMGGTQADLFFVEWSDRDAGCSGIGECNPQRPWWDLSNQTPPNPARAMQWENALSVAAQRRLILWQVPAGNLGLNNTCQHYQDNRADYAFHHPRDLVEAGVIAVLFGGGAACSTQPSTDGGFIQAQGAIAYGLPTAPIGLSADPALGPVVPLHWAENSEGDLWRYQLSYIPVGGGASGTIEVGIGNTAWLLLPTAGQWQVTVAAIDALGQVGPASSPIMVTTTTDAARVFLPVIVKH